MNYKILQRINFYRIFKLTTILCALFLAFSTQLSIASNYLNLRACDASFTRHRDNCADLIDLPLCNDVIDDSATGANPGVNCALECNDPSITNPTPNASPALVRGVDYARHGQHCIRFCDTLSSPENDFNIALNPSPAGVLDSSKPTNCIRRKCHQLPSGTLANNNNCSMLKCNLLTVNELRNPRFIFNNPNYDPEDLTATPPPRFCDGENVKCYSFSQEKLPYVKIWPINSMCQIHNCKPPSPSCAIPDDTLNITSNTSTLLGKTYEQDYVRYINANNSLSNDAVCNPVICKPVAKRPYLCTGNNEDVRNDFCDPLASAGQPPNPGSICNSGYCYKTINCNDDGSQNKPDNRNEPECLASGTDVDDSTDAEIEATDTINSWFYRPAPLSKATIVDSSGKRVLKQMEPKLCYSSTQFKKYWGDTASFLGYFHYVYPPTGETTSPERCMRKSGVDGTGYTNLCGTHNNVGRRVSSVETLYHRGYVVSSYTEDQGVHKLMVCARFYNSTHINADSETCGRRECAVAASFGDWTYQFCGNDVCRVLRIKDSDPKECDSNSDNDMFDGHDTGKGCNARLGNDGTVNGYLRVRAVKYGNRICTFLDVKGLRGGIFMNGTEKLSDGTCLSGETARDGSCTNARNSNTTRDNLEKWRTAVKAHYIDDNQDGPVNGYLDQSGRLFEASECPKVRPRISPPRMYNLATSENTPRLFIPPIFISQSMVKRGGVAAENVGGALGETDFYFPEIEITFGSVKRNLSLGMNFTGYESDSTSSPSDPAGKTDILLITKENIRYNISLFVRKELDVENNDPLFCLYRKLVDENGSILEPLRMECVKRSKPEINDPSVKKQALIIDRVPLTGSLNNSSIALRYIDFGNNLRNNNCSNDDSCTPTITLNNPTTSTKVCDSGVEKYKICSERDECTRLRVECLQNEIDLQAAKKNGSPTNAFLDYRSYCNNQLLSSCFARKGLSAPSGASTLENDPFKAQGIANSYGLFSEICITSGFQAKLRQVIAYQLPNGVMGKCLIDETKKSPSADCIAGGNAKLGCPCLAYDPQNHSLRANETSRLETPREAGLCVDMPEPGYCPSVSYGTDPDINFSIGKNEYGVNGVHQSHQNRSENSTYGHATLPKAVPGMVDVEGECLGFWINSNASRKPTVSCLPSTASSPSPTWGVVSNSCVRYSCPQVYTSGPNIRGEYQGNYTSNDIPGTGSEGYFHGYANWPSYTKTNDFAEDVDASKFENPNAIQCIAGFRKIDSFPHIDPTTNKIDYYTGGISPKRQCNQVGQYLETTMKCNRIYCETISPPDPRNFAENSHGWWDAWSQWNKSKGATFPRIPASRSTRDEPQQESPKPESISIGTCNESLGFFQIEGAEPPSLSCDHLGNWREIKNPCATKCDAVTSTSNPPASDPSNGFAYWNKVDDVPIDIGFKDGVFGGCISGYIPNPYPPARGKDGTLLSPEIANDLTRPAGNPERLCKSVATVGGQRNTWTQPSSSCINKCPGAATDPRIGVGITRHPVSFGNGIEEVSWNDTDLGQYAIKYGPQGSSCGAVEANHFFEGRENHCYVLRRLCDTNGRWRDVAPSCVARYYSNNSDGTVHLGGELENAYYNTVGTTPGFNNSAGAVETIATSTSSLQPGTFATGTCVSGYWESDSTPGSRGTSNPKRQCFYENSSKFIDKVYWKLVNENCKRVQCPAQDIPASGPYSSGGVSRNRTNLVAVSSGFVGETRPITCNASDTNLFGISPSVTCREDGTWSEVSNINNCRRSCLASGAFTNDANNNRRINDSGGGNGLYFYTPSFGTSPANIRHDQEISFTFSDHSSGDATKYSNASRCNDGAWVFPSTFGNNSVLGALATGSSRRFDWNTNSWVTYVGGVGNGAACINTRENTQATGDGSNGGGAISSPNCSLVGVNGVRQNVSLRWSQNSH